MNEGITLQQLASRIEEKKRSKRDFLAPARSIELIDDHRISLNGVDDVLFGSNDWFHRQTGEFLDVPKKYQDMIRRDHPALYTTTFNTLMRSKNGTQRLIRTMDGTARAFLSSRYRRIDDEQMLEAVLPVLAETKDLVINSA